MKIDRLLLGVPRPRGRTMFSSSEVSIPASLTFWIPSSPSIPAPFLWHSLQSNQVLREVQVPGTCVITIAPQHRSLDGIPVTEAERGSCEKLVPRETGASLNLCVD